MSNEESRNNENLEEPEWKTNLKKGLSVFKQKLGEGLKKTGDAVKKVGQNVKIKIDEKMANQNNTAIKLEDYANVPEDQLPEAFCVCCGSALSPELRQILFQGQQCVCETCGELLKLDERK